MTAAFTQCGGMHAKFSHRGLPALSADLALLVLPGAVLVQSGDCIHYCALPFAHEPWETAQVVSPYTRCPALT
eukprot:1987580-Rhodomonas_salina.3